MGLFNDTALVARLLLLIMNGLPFWLALRSLCRCLILLDAILAVRIFVVAVAGFGSMLNPYLTTLNNHTPAAAAAMFAITAAVEILTLRLRSATSGASTSMRGRLFVALGFFAALTCCFELPAALLGVLSFALAAMIDRRLTLTRYVPAAVIPLAAFFITNWMATGGMIPFTQRTAQKLTFTNTTESPVTGQIREIWMPVMKRRSSICSTASLAITEFSR